MDDDDAYTIPQQASLALTPKVSALISALGSSLILREVWLDRKDGSDKPTSRVLVSVSVADLFFSSSWFLSTWASPSDLDYIWGNVGNQQTCVFEAFLFQLGWVASALSNISLMVFFLLIVRHNYSDRKLATIETPLYLGMWTFSLLCSIYPIPLGLYNNSWEVCWFDAHPIGCDVDDDVPCERGETAWIHAVVFSVFPSWFAVLVAIVVMWLIFSSVRDVENRMSRYAGAMVTSESTQQTRGGKSIRASNDSQRGNNSTRASHDSVDGEQRTTSPANRGRSQKVAEQAIWYIGGLLICYAFEMVFCILYYVNEIGYYPSDLISYILLPLQGFFNFVVFARTREMKSESAKFVKRIVFSCGSLLFVCRRRNDDCSNDEATKKTKSTTRLQTSVATIQSHEEGNAAPEIPMAAT